tara:strand:- start:21659 stop:30079 length:8421 start_codon:yes stop_codon:yes gene_type:complete
MSLSDVLDNQKKIAASLAASRKALGIELAEDRIAKLPEPDKEEEETPYDAVEAKQEPKYVTPAMIEAADNAPSTGPVGDAVARINVPDTETEQRTLRLPPSMQEGLSKESREAIRSAVNQGMDVSVGEEIAYIAYHMNSSKKFRDTLEARYNTIPPERQVLVDLARELEISPEDFIAKGPSYFERITGRPAFKGPDALIAQLIPQDSPVSAFLQGTERQKVSDVQLGPQKDYQINAFVSTEKGLAINGRQVRTELEQAYYNDFVRKGEVNSDADREKYKAESTELAIKDIARAVRAGRNIMFAPEVDPKRVEKYSKIPYPLSPILAYLSPQRQAIDPWSPTTEELSKEGKLEEFVRLSPLDLGSAGMRFIREHMEQGLGTGNYPDAVLAAASNEGILNTAGVVGTQLFEKSEKDIIRNIFDQTIFMDEMSEWVGFGSESLSLMFGASPESADEIRQTVSKSFITRFASFLPYLVEPDAFSVATGGLGYGAAKAAKIQRIKKAYQIADILEAASEKSNVATAFNFIEQENKAAHLLAERKLFSEIQVSEDKIEAVEKQIANLDKLTLTESKQLDEIKDADQRLFSDPKIKDRITVYENDVNDFVADIRFIDEALTSSVGLQSKAEAAKKLADEALVKATNMDDEYNRVYAEFTQKKSQLETLAQTNPEFTALINFGGSVNPKRMGFEKAKIKNSQDIKKKDSEIRALRRQLASSPESKDTINAAIKQLREEKKALKKANAKIDEEIAIFTKTENALIQEINKKARKDPNFKMAWQEYKRLNRDLSADSVGSLSQQMFKLLEDGYVPDAKAHMQKAATDAANAAQKANVSVQKTYQAFTNSMYAYYKATGVDATAKISELFDAGNVSKRLKEIKKELGTTQKGTKKYEKLRAEKRKLEAETSLITTLSLKGQKKNPALVSVKKDLRAYTKLLEARKKNAKALDEVNRANTWQSILKDLSSTVRSGAKKITDRNTAFKYLTTRVGIPEMDALEVSPFLFGLGDKVPYSVFTKNAEATFGRDLIDETLTEKVLKTFPKEHRDLIREAFGLKKPKAEEGGPTTPPAPEAPPVAPEAPEAPEAPTPAPAPAPKPTPAPAPTPAPPPKPEAPKPVPQPKPAPKPAPTPTAPTTPDPDIVPGSGKSGIGFFDDPIAATLELLEKLNISRETLETGGIVQGIDAESLVKVFEGNTALSPGRKYLMDECLKRGYFKGVTIDFGLNPGALSAGGWSFKESTSGQASFRRRKIALNLGHPSFKDLGDTICHELLHMATLGQIYGVNARVTSLGLRNADGTLSRSKIKKYLNSLSDQERKKIGPQVESIVELYSLEKKVRKAFNKSGIRSLGPYDRTGKKRYNAKQTPIELISWAYNDRKFMDWLKTVEVAENKSAFSAFVETVLSLLGIKPTNKDALTELTRITEDILDVGRKDTPVRPEDVDITASMKPADIQSRLKELVETQDPDNIKQALELAETLGVKLDLNNASLRNIDLSDINLRGVNLSGADLRWARLSEANLRRANLRDADLSGADLYWAYLTSADLSGATLNGANLSGAYFRKANLKKANLSNANLENADLHGANLRGANLSETDLWSAILTKSDLRGAKYSDSTKFPERFNPVAEGMIKVDDVVASKPIQKADTPQSLKEQISNAFKVMDFDLGMRLTEKLAELRKSNTQTPEFKQWFKGSKIVDSSGAPLTVFHGGANVEKGSRAFKVSPRGALGSGIYLTPDLKFARDYAADYAIKNDTTGSVFTGYVSIKKPLEIRERLTPTVDALVQLGVPETKARKIVEKAEENYGYVGRQIQTRAIAKGYDGIIQYGKDGKVKEIVAFKPSQVKSQDNVGTWNAASDNVVASKPTQKADDAPTPEPQPEGKFENLTRGGTDSLRQALAIMYQSQTKANKGDFDYRLALHTLQTEWKVSTGDKAWLKRWYRTFVTKMTDPGQANIRSRFGETNLRLSRVYKGTENVINKTTEEAIQLTEKIFAENGGAVDGLYKYVDNTDPHTLKDGFTTMNNVQGLTVFEAARRAILSDSRVLQVLSTKKKKGAPKPFEELVKEGVLPAALIGLSRMWMKQASDTKAGELAVRAARLLKNKDITTFEEFQNKLMGVTVGVLGEENLDTRRSRAIGLGAKAVIHAAGLHGMTHAIRRELGAVLSTKEAEDINIFMQGLGDISEGKKKKGVANFNTAVDNMLNYGLTMAGRTVEAGPFFNAKKRSRDMLNIAKGSYIPSAAVQEIDSALSKQVKQLEAVYTSTGNELAAKAAQNGLAILRLTKTGMTTGLFIPKPQYFTFAAMSDLAQIWFSHGVKSAAKAAIPGALGYMPYGRKLVDRLSRTMGEKGGRMARSATDFVFDPHVTRFWDINTADDAIMEIAGNKYVVGDLRRIATEAGVMDTFIHQNLAEVIRDLRIRQEETKWYKKLARAGLDKAKIMQSWTDDFAMVTQQRMRTVLWFQKMQDGLSPEKAARGVDDALYDWSHGVNRNALLYMAQIFPFYRYWNLALQQVAKETLKPITAGSMKEVVDMGLKGQTGQARLKQLSYFYENLLAETLSGPQSEPKTEQDAYAEAFVPGWPRGARAITAPRRLTQEERLELGRPKDSWLNGMSEVDKDILKDEYMFGILPALGPLDSFEMLLTPLKFGIAMTLIAAGEDSVADDWMAKSLDPIVSNLYPTGRGMADRMIDDWFRKDIPSNSVHIPIKPSEAQVLMYMSKTPVLGAAWDNPFYDEEKGRWMASKKGILALRMLPVVGSQIPKLLDDLKFKNPYNKRQVVDYTRHALMNIFGVVKTYTYNPDEERDKMVEDFHFYLNQKKKKVEGLK